MITSFFPCFHLLRCVCCEVKPYLNFTVMKLDIGEMLFSDLPRAKRRRQKLWSFLIIIFVALLVGGCITLILIFENRTGGGF